MFNNQSILITGGTGSFGKKYTQIILETYIDNNVTDLESAKDVLKVLAKAIVILGRREFL